MRYFIRLLNLKKKFLVIFITVLCAALEAASVVSLAPFISSIIGGDNSNYTNAEWIRRYLNLESVLFYSIVLVSAYFFKIVFVLMMAWIQSGFIYSAINSVGCDLFKHYASRPYEYFFSVDVSAVIRNVTTETALLAGVLKSCVLLGTELIVLFTLLLVILLIDYRVALFAIGIFLVLSLSYLYFLKPLLIRWGQERQILEGRRIAYLRYALNFNKDIKSISLKDKIREIIENSNDEISLKEINKKLQKSNEQLPLSTHLDILEDENVIFKINPGIYLNFKDAIRLCDRKEIEEYLDEVLDRYEFITNVFIREKINEDLGYALSTSYYSSLVKVLAKENNWFCGFNYLSKKQERKMATDEYIKSNYDNNISINDNFSNCSKKIGVSKTYFYNIVYINKLNFSTDWIHTDD